MAPAVTPLRWMRIDLTGQSINGVIDTGLGRFLLHSRVIAYDETLVEVGPGGLQRQRIVGRYWTGWIHDERLPGRWATAEEAMAAVDAAHAAGSDVAP